LHDKLTCARTSQQSANHELEIEFVVIFIIIIIIILSIITITNITTTTVVVVVVVIIIIIIVIIDLPVFLLCRPIEATVTLSPVTRGQASPFLPQRQGCYVRAQAAF